MGKTKIEWADAVWNPVTGCTKVSAGCANCYAERMAARFGRSGVPASPCSRAVLEDMALGRATYDWSNVLTHPDRLDQPFRWRKPRRVFVCSMGDLFHEYVTDSFIYDVLNVIVAVKRHTFMVLTKRPERMHAIMAVRKIPMPANLWLGVSVENQPAADERITLLLRTPAAVRFVSVEPMLGPVGLWRGLWIPFYLTPDDVPDEDPREVGYPPESMYTKTGKLDWVICGGESGPGARPMHPDWARSLRDQCVCAGVPFFFKQWGEWSPSMYGDGRRSRNVAAGDGTHHRMYAVGKTASGRLLDGREWSEIPGMSR